GESLGAAVAVGLAVQRPPAALVLRSPFTSLAEVGAVHYPWLPLRRLLLDHYPSIERIASVHAPVLVIAGGSDDIVPATLSERLVAAAAEPKRYVVVPGVGHNDPELLDGRVMLDAIRRFLTETAVLGQ
ncbi:alpha/beta hydrolase, partial [Mycobacterium tuberculosis]